MPDNNRNKTPVKPTAPAAKPASRNTATTKPAVAPAAKTVTARDAQTKPTASATSRTAPPARTATPTRQAAAPRTAITPAANKPAAQSVKPTPARTPVSAAKQTSAAETKSVRSEPPAKSAVAPAKRGDVADKSAARKETAATVSVRAAADKNTEKPARVKADKSEKTSDGGKRRNGNNSVAATKTKKPLSKRNRIIIMVTAAVLAVVICLTVILVSCKGDKIPDSRLVPGTADSIAQMTRPSDNIFVSESDIEEGSFVNNYKNRTKVGYNAEYLGTVARNIPTEMQDGGLPTGYPLYGKGLNLSQEERVAIINENWNLCTINTRIGSDGYPKNTYNKMDKFGNLYLNGEDTGRDLYKHTLPR